MSHNTKQKLKKLNKVISKEHPEFELTIDMMLGIRTAFSRSMNEVPKEKLEVADFSEEVCLIIIFSFKIIFCVSFIIL